MRRYLLVLFLLPLAARDIRVIRLSEADAKALAQVAQRKEAADANWDSALRYLRSKYITQRGIAEAGDAQIDVKVPQPGWDNGFDISDDYTVLVAKSKPCEAAQQTAPEQ